MRGFSGDAENVAEIDVSDVFCNLNSKQFLFLVYIFRILKITKNTDKVSSKSVPSQLFLIHTHIPPISSRVEKRVN